MSFIFCSLPSFAVSVTCDVCGSDYVNVDEYYGTCLVEGYIRTYCDNCGASHRRNTGFGDHNYLLSDYIAPSCVKDGSETFSCSVCFDSYNVSLPADPSLHVMEHKMTVAPGFDDGYELYECSVCHYQETKVLPAVSCDHMYKEIGRVEATEGSSGVVTYGCSNCGHLKYEELDYVSPVPSDTSALMKTVLTGVWGMTDVYVPGFNFTIRQMWIGFFLCSVSLIVIRLLLGIGASGVSSRTSSTSNAKISDERKRDEY